MSTSVAGLNAVAAQHHAFFDLMMGKVPTYFLEREKTQSKPNSKYLYKKKGYNAAQHKSQTMNDDDDDDDASQTASEQLSFEAPRNYADQEELRKRLQAKIDESRQKMKMDDDATYQQRKQQRLARKEQNQKQKRIQRQKTRAADAPEPTKPSAEGAKLKKAKTNGQESNNDQQLVQLPSADNTQVVTKKKSSKKDDIELDLSFAPVVKGYQEKSIDKAGTVAQKKGNKERQLKELQSFDEKIKALREDGRNNEADAVIREQKLDAALRRAAGEIVKDDADKLSRTLKRKEAKKEVSRKKWGQRVREQERQQKTKQDLRSLHISKKIEHKKEKRRRKD